jgi:fucose 4-O-acetylase-like acetyltransferase
MIDWQLIQAVALVILMLVLAPPAFYLTACYGHNHDKPERRGKRWVSQTAMAIVAVMLCLTVLVCAYLIPNPRLWDNWYVSVFAIYLAADMTMDAVLAHRVAHNESIYSSACYAVVALSMCSAVVLIGTVLCQVGDAALSYFAWTSPF